MLIAIAIAGGAAAQDAPRPEALLEELHVASISQVQEQGEIQFTLALSSQKAGGAALRDSIGGQFEIEIGVTDRFQLSMEGEVLDRSALAGGSDDIEVGAAYEVFRGSTSNLIVAVESRANHLRETEIRMTSAWRLRRAELHSGMSLEQEDGKRNVSIDVAAIWPWAAWRGTLEVHHDSAFRGSPSIIPGVAWTRDGLQLGLGVALSSESESSGRLMLNTAIEF